MGAYIRALKKSTYELPYECKLPINIPDYVIINGKEIYPEMDSDGKSISYIGEFEHIGYRDEIWSESFKIKIYTTSNFDTVISHKPIIVEFFIDTSDIDKAYCGRDETLSKIIYSFADRINHYIEVMGGRR